MSSNSGVAIYSGVVSGSGGGPTPPPYHASAVHFDANSFMRVVDQGNIAVNSSQVAVSFWIKIADISDFPALFTIYADPGSSAYIDVIFYVGYNFASDLSFYVAPGQITPFVFGGSADSLFTVDVWHHVFFSIDTNFASGLKPSYLYFDGVDVIDPANSTDGTDAFIIPFNGNTSITSGGSILQPRKAYDICDVQVFSQLIVPTPTNLAKFISGGKPVDPAVAAATFGQHQLLLSGDAAGFQVNPGTWGTDNIVIVTGSLTNASTSPSD